MRSISLVIKHAHKLFCHVRISLRAKTLHLFKTLQSPETMRSPGSLVVAEISTKATATTAMGVAKDILNFSAATQP